MKKKVFFLLGAMNVGGVEKSFLSLIDTLSPKNYEIHLGLINPVGGYMSSIPKYVLIHYIDCYEPYRMIINDPPRKVIIGYLRNKKIKTAFLLTWYYVICKITKSRLKLYDYMLKDIPSFDYNFDIAIAYAGPSQMIDYYIVNKVNAAKKIGWIHFDITKFGIDKGMVAKLYKFYDVINIVSRTAKIRFDEIFPQFADKTKVFYNIVSESKIRSLSSFAESFDDVFEGIRILTVGRISKEKGQYEAIIAINELVKKGIDIRYYLVGEGSDMFRCKNLVENLGLHNRVIFLGMKTNPYGFMKGCDIYLQPSRHEGYCITLAEAKIFHMPIVTTNFTGADEQLEKYPKAVVTEMAPINIYNGLDSIISMYFSFHHR